VCLVFAPTFVPHVGIGVYMYHAHVSVCHVCYMCVDTVSVRRLRAGACVRACVRVCAQWCFGVSCSSCDWRVQPKESRVVAQLRVELAEKDSTAAAAFLINF